MRKRLGQVDPQHRFDNCVLEWLFSVGRYTASDFVTAVKGFSDKRRPKVIELDLL